MSLWCAPVIKDVPPSEEAIAVSSPPNSPIHPSNPFFEANLLIACLFGTTPHPTWRFKSALPILSANPRKLIRLGIFCWFAPLLCISYFAESLSGSDMLILQVGCLFGSPWSSLPPTPTPPIFSKFQAMNLSCFSPPPRLFFP